MIEMSHREGNKNSPVIPTVSSNSCDNSSFASCHTKQQLDQLHISPTTCQNMQRWPAADGNLQGQRCAKLAAKFGYVIPRTNSTSLTLSSDKSNTSCAAHCTLRLRVCSATTRRPRPTNRICERKTAPVRTELSVSDLQAFCCMPEAAAHVDFAAHHVSAGLMQQMRIPNSNTCAAKIRCTV